MQLRKFIETLEKIEDEHGDVDVEDGRNLDLHPAAITLVRDEDDDSNVVAVAIDK